MAARKPPRDFEMLPFTVAIDQREKAPYGFGAIPCDAKERGKALVVPTNTQYLKTGDYSIVGMESMVCVERKSLEDAYGTFTHHRVRFEDELNRMQGMKYAAVVIEAGYNDILFRPPYHCKTNPKTIVRSIIAWSQRFPTIHWFPAGSRRNGELFTIRILQRFFKDYHDANRTAA